MTGCPGQQIYLIGANRLFNELLARCIAEQTGAQCSIAATLCSIPPSVDYAGQKRLVLFDFSQNCQSLEDLISSDKNNILHSDFLVLTNLSDTLDIECEALQCGVRGFLYYQGGIDSLLEMIQSVLNSEIWISRELMTKLLLYGGLNRRVEVNDRIPALTVREANILNGLAMGLTNKKIADTFCLSPHTVKTHLYHIFKKIKVKNRLQAVLWASQHL